MYQREEKRKMVNLGNSAGSVAPGDEVFAAMRRTLVARVVIHNGAHAPAGCPVHGVHVVEVICASGARRWIGADRAAIGADLRVHWSRS